MPSFLLAKRMDQPDETPSRAQSGPPSDLELVELYRDREMGEAFAELVRKYQVRLFRVLLGMVGDKSLADELCQRVFVKAALRIKQLKDGQAFYAWILAIARTTAMDELRKQARFTSESDAPEEGASGTYDEQESVRIILAQLSPEDRMALILTDMQELSMKEVAEALGVGVSAAKMRVKRARERFRTLYQEQT